MTKKEISNKKAFSDTALFVELSQLIEQSQRQVASYANSTLTVLFWHIGKRINEEVLDNQRADYGEKILPTVSAKLEKKYGKNFNEKNIRRMVKFVQEFPDFQIVVPLSRQLSWSHFIEMFPLKTEEEKLFYAELSVRETLGVRELRKQIAGKTFERTEIANLQTSQTDILPLNTFKDPYLLDFLGLQKGYLEKDVETAILNERN